VQGCLFGPCQVLASTCMAQLTLTDNHADAQQHADKTEYARQCTTMLRTGT
jgi:hypothetical protein